MKVDSTIAGAGDCDNNVGGISSCIDLNGSTSACFIEVVCRRDRKGSCIVGSARRETFVSGFVLSCRI